MKNTHSFHIPVMGLSYTIDTPIKVARFGINSVVSIMEDHLIEKMRAHYSKEFNFPFEVISSNETDSRARRITAYLNLLNQIVDQQIHELKLQEFSPNTDLTKYFTLLERSHPLAILYNEYLNYKNDNNHKKQLETELRSSIVAGSIDVNIMTKIDGEKYDKEGNSSGPEYTYAVSALRGYAKSNLKNSNLVLSAGLNPRLMSSIGNFDDFFPDAEGNITKKIILKVSDYRSALIQGKFLAKKGIFVSEFRIESGLNCGGHAFPTDGILMGPILEEFKTKWVELNNTLKNICNQTLTTAGKFPVNETQQLLLSAQGGIGTSSEHHLLLNNYPIHSVGWGSPFLLVPEVVNIERNTLEELSSAQPEDYVLSNSSPLGIPFNNFKKSSSNIQMAERMVKNRPGSPCVKEFLAFNTEFTKTPICTASRQFQDLKIKELKKLELDQEAYELALQKITEKECLCEGLSNGALLETNMLDKGRPQGVSICPGPNLAYFSGVFTLNEMAGHIYGKISLLNKVKRSHFFINEANLYVDYLKKKLSLDLNSNTSEYYISFKNNILSGLEYYQKMFNNLNTDLQRNLDELQALIKTVQEISIEKPKEALC